MTEHVIARDQLRAFIERIEEDAILETYLAALGMIEGPVE